MNRSHSPEEIHRACSEAAVWAAANWSWDAPRSSLRALELSPDLFDRDPCSASHQVIAARRVEIQRQGLGDAAVADGALLVHDPDEVLDECMCEQATDGFFDESDRAPWDLVVGYRSNAGSGYLLFWIPASLHDLVEVGIEVSSTEAFVWASSIDEAWARTLCASKAR